jgi:hypothetical protein
MTPIIVLTPPLPSSPTNLSKCKPEITLGLPLIPPTNPTGFFLIITAGGAVLTVVTMLASDSLIVPPGTLVAPLITITTFLFPKHIISLTP